MKQLPLRQSRHLLAAAAFGFGLLAAPMFASLAHAFTVENQDSSGATSQNFRDLGTQPATDPDDQVKSRFGSGGPGTLKSGDATFQFGAQPSFQQKYNPSRMFDPLGGPGDPR